MNVIKLYKAGGPDREGLLEKRELVRLIVIPKSRQGDRHRLGYGMY